MTWSLPFHYSPSTVQGNNITYKISDAGTTLQLFKGFGFLDNQEVAIDVKPGSNSGETIVFAISRDLGIIQATQAPVVWAIGYTTDPAISYAAQSDTRPQQRSPYYKLQYPQAGDHSLVSRSMFVDAIVLI